MASKISFSHEEIIYGSSLIDLWVILDYRYTMNRQSDPPDDRGPIRALEVEFAIPVYLSREQERTLQHLLDDIVNAPYNQPEGQVHWVSGYGSKPHWSQQDAQFLGKPSNPNSPESGEPTFDDSVFHIESAVKDKT
ncbi:hypothetical protein KAR91_54915 [Candidatus Pacearchaeota archaeon]|nr:hypothetical protein [Candidatus Pacearchaeota archaeon]